MALGPVGGANFLSVDELTSPMNTFNTAEVNSIKLRDYIDEKDLLKKKRSDLETIAKNEFDMASKAFAPQQDTQSAPVVQQPTVSGPKTEVQSPVTQSAPTEGAQTYPVAPTPSQMTPAQVQATQAANVQQSQPTPVSPSTPTPVMPQATVQPTVMPQAAMPQAAMPQPTAQPTAMPQGPVAPPTSLPPTDAGAAKPSVADQIIQRFTGAPLVGDQVNPLSETVFNARLKGVQQLVQEGKISATTGKEYIDTITKARDTQLTSMANLAEKMQAIQESDLTLKQKALTTKALIRADEDNRYADVYRTFKSGDKEQAAILAKEYGLNIDFNKPSDLVTLQNRAMRAPDTMAQRKQTAEEAKIVLQERAQSKWQPSTTQPGVYFRTAPDGSIETTRNPDSTGGATGSDGKVSAVQTDKFGNSKLDPVVVKPLVASQKAATGAISALNDIDKIEKEGILDKQSQSGIGRAVVGAQGFVGMNSEMRSADSFMKSFANSALGIIESPLMKGSPSENDARRALSVISDPEAPLDVKKAAVQRLKGMLQEAVSSHNEALSQYDDKTTQRLSALGIKPVSVKSSATSGATVTMISPKGSIVQVPVEEVEQASSLGFKKASK